MNFFQMLALSSTIGAELELVKAEIDAGQPTDVPPFRTYIDGQHVEIDMHIAPVVVPT